MTVPTMITTAETMSKDSTSAIHPFFSKGIRPLQTSTSQDTLPTRKSSGQSSNSASAKNNHPGSDTARTTRANTKAKRPASTRRSARSNSREENDSSNAAQSLEVDPNAGRRKRQKRPSADDTEQDGVVQIASPTPPRNLNGEDIDESSLQWLAELEAAAARDESPESSSGSVQTGPEPNHRPSSRTDEKTSLAVEATDSLPRDEGAHLISSVQSLAATGDESTHKTTTAPVVKLVHFNPKTGTIGSPPKQPQRHEKVLKRKVHDSKLSKRGKSKIIVMKYGQDVLSKSMVGEKVNQILQGVSTMGPPLSVSKAARNESKHEPAILKLQPREPLSVENPSKSDEPPKVTHPFFLGKGAAGVQQESPASKDNYLDTNTPHVDTQSPPVPKEKSRLVSHVSPIKKPQPRSDIAVFSKAQKSTRSLGSWSPAWPWRGMVHVRGHSEDNSLLDFQCDEHSLHLSSTSTKKSKGSAVQVLVKEDLLSTFGAKFAIGHQAGKLQVTNPDKYEEPSQTLRIPSKEFKSGRELQQQIHSQILTPLPRTQLANEDSSSDDELQGNGRFKSKSHPAVSLVYKSIATSLSAFDRYECETQSWVHKYAPSSAELVLQSGREALILRDWLKTLTVKLVETGQKEGKAKSSTRGDKGPSKKKKKTGKAMGSFVVDSDVEDDDMDEISDLDDGLHSTAFRGSIQKTVVRNGDFNGKGQAKLKNAVVISGPCGCGKTAAVYAVAKELDFEIFEINPGSRRSGKDILEKVGDMTRNHLVQGSTEDKQAFSDDDAKRISDALDQDLQSGRQGTMNSFFKPAANKVKAKSKNTEPKAVNTDFAKPAPKKQKQSLILIEEVDLIYEEDKQFWPTVIALIAQSKRPVIMTCNDESVVPLNSLSLHAIIRFTPAPIDVAVDYMLLVAANEGHVLRRAAVKALYESRGADLRGSLTELQFWCQFAVGDPRNGLAWRYDRWPPDCDTDNHGNTIRTISENTYETGMGWLSRDLSDENHFEESLSILDMEEETLRQAWHGWQIDAGDWHQTLDLSKWAEDLRSNSKCKADEEVGLNIYGYFVDAMSITDVCAGSEFASGEKTMLDCTNPDLPERVRDDYSLGYQLLHADELTPSDSLSSEISVWLKSRVREHILVDQLQHGWKGDAEMNCLTEKRMIKKIRKVVTSSDGILTRRDLSCAFDPIASDPEKIPSSSLEPSVFDRTITSIVLDVAPFVRSIVSYDARLQQERLRLSNLVSSGSRAGKRKIRSTRAAHAALEGGIRKTTRPERYFGNILNADLVLQTGKKSWQDAVTS